MKARCSPRLAPRLLLTCSILVAGSPPARSEEASSARNTVSADLLGVASPDGLMLTVGVLRHWSAKDLESPLLRGRYLEIGVSAGVNPAYAQGSLFVEGVFLAPLQLRAQYDAYGFFGRNGGLLRFPSASSRFGKAEIEAAAGSERSGLGHRLIFSPALRVQLGRIVLQSQTDLAWYALSSEAGWYYEIEYDTLLAERDVLLSNRSALLVELWRRGAEATLLAGPAYEVTHAVKSSLTRQRAEAVLSWTPADGLGAVHRPRLFAVAGVNLQDRNRACQPFGILGVGADLDF